MQIWGLDRFEHTLVSPHKIYSGWSAGAPVEYLAYVGRRSGRRAEVKSYQAVVNEG